MSEEINILQNRFDEIVQRDTESEVEFWYARNLQLLLGYARWENFQVAIQRAIQSCETSGFQCSDHFREVTKMVSLGSGSQREIIDYKLTRYACYLIAQNGDPKKREIAFAQCYFAVQTRRQELIQDRMNLLTRLENREKLRESEKRLSKNIYERGVDDAGFGRIRNQGDMALFGKGTKQMKTHLGMPESRPLADFLPSVTIAAKNLAVEMTNLNVESNNLQGEHSITHEHVQNNRGVREMMISRGIRPETLPAEEDILKLERRVNSEEKRIEKTSRLGITKKNKREKSSDNEL